MTKTWRLNERHYGKCYWNRDAILSFWSLRARPDNTTMYGVTGALQGFNKDTAWKELGLDQELVMQMRRSYDVRPPRMEDDHIHWHGNDRRYAGKCSRLDLFGFPPTSHTSINHTLKVQKADNGTTGSVAWRVFKGYSRKNHAFFRECDHTSHARGK